MKKLLLIFASAFLMFACTQEEGVLPENEGETPQVENLTTAEAQIRFAKLLSKAASGSAEVRRFLKEEAVKQFDNDYDVFYPMVKNKIVSDGKTFRDVLLSYCDDPKELVEVERSQLLLNILIPDLTLVWDFNADLWNTDNEEIVVMCRDDVNDTMFERGEAIGQVAKGDIPGFPCLVVKNNERVRVKNVNTRSGEATYEFIDDVFDGSKRLEGPLTRHYDTDITIDATEDLDAYVPQSQIPDFCIKAYEEFKNVPNAYQRDYIYYGIDKNNNPGTLNRNIREEIFRFSIAAKSYTTISDQESKDPKLQNHTEHKRTLSVEDIRKKIWSGGNFEFEFTSYIAGDTEGQAMKANKVFNVPPQDVFSITQVHLHHKNSTMFRESKNFYTVDVNNLRSKWIYPRRLESNYTENYVFTEPWDLYGKSLTIFLFISERDDSQTINEKKSTVSEFVNKADFSIDGDGKIDKVGFKSKLGYGISYTTTRSNEMTITTEVGSDDLGSISYRYYDPIIRNRDNNGNCKLFNMSSGVVSVTLLPVDVSK